MLLCESSKQRVEYVSSALIEIGNTDIDSENSENPYSDHKNKWKPMVNEKFVAWIVSISSDWEDYQNYELS